MSVLRRLVSQASVCPVTPLQTMSRPCPFSTCQWHSVNGHLRTPRPIVPRGYLLAGPLTFRIFARPAILACSSVFSTRTRSSKYKTVFTWRLFWMLFLFGFPIPLLWFQFWQSQLVAVELNFDAAEDAFSPWWAWRFDLRYTDRRWGMLQWATTRLNVVPTSTANGRRFWIVRCPTAATRNCEQLKQWAQLLRAAHAQQHYLLFLGPFLHLLRACTYPMRSYPTWTLS